MREKDMRARVERLLGRQLRSLIGPPALGVGLALTTACRAHVPECKSPTVYDFEDDANPACAISRPDGVPIYSAYAPPEPLPPVPGPPEPDSTELGSPALPPSAPPPGTYRTRPEEAARVIHRAIERCDRLELRAAILTHEELSTLLAQPPDEATYTEMVTDWMAAQMNRICPSSETAALRHLADPKINSVVAVRSGSEWKSPLTLVLVSLPPFQGDPVSPNPRPPVTLVKLDDHWRILLKTP